MSLRKANQVCTAAQADHAPSAYGLLDQRFVFQKIRLLMLRHPRAIAVGPEGRIAKPEGILLALQETAHEFVGPKLLSCRVPPVAIGDFDWRTAVRQGNPS